MIRDTEAETEDRQKRSHIHVIGADLGGKQNSGLELVFNTIIQENVSEMRLEYTRLKSTVKLGKLSWNIPVRHVLVKI